MYQSVMAKRQATGSSATGFFFAVVKVVEVHPDRDLVLVEDMNTTNQQDLPISKRGETAWPQVGDIWVMDRSMGHWMLQCRVTSSQAPVFTGNSSVMDPDILRLASLLKGLGLIQDGTTAGPVPAPPAFTGSRNTIRPEVQQLIALLDTKGVLDDQTTAETVPLDTWIAPALQGGWTGYTSNGDATVKYKRNYDNTVTVEGRATPPASYTAGDLIFTLNSGYRPPMTKYQSANCANGVSGTITFGTDGTVRLYDFGTATPVRCLFHMRFSLV